MYDTVHYKGEMKVTFKEAFDFFSKLELTDSKYQRLIGW